MKVRRRARVVALQALYEIDLVGHNPGEVLPLLLGENAMGAEGDRFATWLTQGVVAQSPALDEVIARIAPEWPVEQMACIDRNILRMALYELAAGDTPLKVVVNEAIELAKAFGSDSCARFINGALGAFITQGGVARVPALAAMGSGEGDVRL